ncbi:MAG: hypothetical protein AB1430_18055 [Pseudomonadota bacterium]
MKLKSLTLAFALAFAATVHAQQASAPASSPAKKELVQRVLKLQQPGIEAMARQLAEEPVAQLAPQADMALQTKVPADKRDAAMKNVQAEITKYLDEAVPLVRERATKLAPTVMGPMLEERFSEDELRQLASWLESPVIRKYQQMIPELQKGMVEKLAADVRPAVEPKARAMQQAMAKHLGLQPAQAASAPAKQPAKKK